MDYVAERGASLVGRERELAALENLLDAAGHGRGRVALVLGEPGIGKSALVETLAATAAERGVPVAWGRCTETDAPAFWPWRQALRAVGVATLVDGSATASRAELFALVVDQLAAVQRPALLVFEDVQWADPASLALLRFVADVVAGELGRSPSDELAARIADRCGGNPFFAREVARLHASRGAEATPAVPAGVQQVLERRIARLSQPCRDVLAAAAVAGEPDADLLAEVAGQPTATVLHRLGEAVTARLLQADGARLRFAHALVRETVYAQQAPSVLGDLHRRVAEALEERPTWDGRDAAWLAVHWRRASGEHARRTAAARALQAAREARERMGYEQAVQFYEWALEAPPEDVLTLRIEQGEAQVLAGTLATGRDTLRKAAHEAVRADRPRDVARAVLGIGVGGFEVALRDDEQTSLLEQAREGLASPEDNSLRAAVLARLSVASTWRRSADERAELAEESVHLARANGDAATEVAALAAWCDARSGPDHTEARLDRTGWMIGAARRSTDPAGMLLARRLRLVALAERGDFAAVDAEVDAYARTSDRLRLPLYAWPVPVWRGARALMSGDFDAVRHYVAEAEALAERADSANAAMVAVLLRANLLAAAGERESLAEAADLGREITSPYYGELNTLAFFYAAAGREVEARRMLRRKLASGIERPKDSEYIPELWLLGAAAVALGETDAAAAVYEALQPYGHRWAINGIFGTCLGVGAHQLGRLAALLADQEAARRWLDQAREAHETVGASLLVAQTDQALAELTGTAGRGSSGALSEESGSPSGEFRRSGRVWHVRWDGYPATVPDSKGMRDLAALLAVPGREVHVLDLVEAAGGPPAAAAGGDVGERLDKPARDAYRQRLVDIEDDLAEAEARKDSGRADSLRREKEFLAAELAGALGLGGRARIEGDPVERARKAVTMRIRTALKAIAEVNTALAQHLDRSMTTGRMCAYRPERPVRWRL